MTATPIIAMTRQTVISIRRNQRILIVTNLLSLLAVQYSHVCLVFVIQTLIVRLGLFCGLLLCVLFSVIVKNSMILFSYYRTIDCGPARMWSILAFE